jgi:uncharacterized protein YlxW (UPF0749 family)
MRRLLERERSRLLLGALWALLGFGVVILATATATARRADAPHRSDLVGLINTRKRQVNGLDAAVRTLRAEVDRAQRSAGQLSDDERDQAGVVDHLSLVAGTTPVFGAALVVRLSDSTRQPSDPTQASAYQIHDIDLQLIVNALFSAGAQAIALNGNRLVATTPIRAAGVTIVVNFRPLTPPYVIEAIGADRARFEATDIASRFRQWTSAYGLGFSVHHSNKAVLPAYVGRVAITTATPSVLLGPLGAAGTTGTAATSGTTATSGTSGTAATTGAAATSGPVGEGVP